MIGVGGLERRVGQSAGSPQRRAEDLAWLAGMVDGEGSMRISGGRTPELTVTNTHRPSLERFRRLFGVGAIYHWQGKRKMVYRWTVFGTNAMAVLARLRRLLVEKAPQADILLAHRIGRKGVIRSPEEMARRREAVRELARLKRTQPTTD